MVTINAPQMNADKQPVMYTHSLTATRKTKTFKVGESAVCFITRMSDGRFAVMDASFAQVTKHYEVFTESELHESFTE
jgi:hypothetical protein